MPNDHLSLDDDDEPRRKGLSPVAWAGIGCGATVLCVIAFSVFAIALHRARKEREIAQDKAAKSSEAGAPAKKIYLRDEFRKLIMGKTKEEVINLLGKPDRTDEENSFGTYWYYHEIT